ncbi:unnamed protein product [Meganyctiphanes norvegica]|uniref:Uncharacterized protein n=1 Tax=Meganyctiphanes norvegica TaxID=48144 RepID=A0AAV2SQW7_MEGNR
MVNLALLFCIAVILGEGSGITIPKGHEKGEEGERINDNTDEIPVKSQRSYNSLMAGISSGLRNVICDIEGDLESYCPNGYVCCTHTLLGYCCPTDHPVCCSGGADGCCPKHTRCCSGGCCTE